MKVQPCIPHMSKNAIIPAPDSVSRRFGYYPSTWPKSMPMTVGSETKRTPP